MWRKTVLLGEVFPCAQAAKVAKALVNEIIPRFGIPEKTYSDNGTCFVNNGISLMTKNLKIDRRINSIWDNVWPVVLPQLKPFSRHDEEREETLAVYMVEMLTSRNISSVCSRWTCGGIYKTQRLDPQSDKEKELVKPKVGRSISGITYM